MTTTENSVCLPTEAEAYVESLQAIDIPEIGGPKWIQHHEYVERLNMQAAISASQQEDEYVKEFLITYEKIPVLVQDLIATETWKTKVFPEFVEKEIEPKVMFPVYMILYHEATVCNLLETVLFHRDAAESAEDSVLDLLDYCYRKLTRLIAISSNKEADDEDVDVSGNADASSLEELQAQNKKLDFDISIKAVSILRYITDHLPGLPLSVATRLLNTHDAPVMLVQLVESPPWAREKNGKLEKYIDNKWEVVSNADRFKLTKIEGQVWLSLYQLLMSEDCQNKYELDPYRKSVIMKLRSYVSEVLVDQVPVLGDLQRYLEQLTVMDPPPPKRDLVLEQVPEIRDRLLQKYEGKWTKIAKKQNKTFFDPAKCDMKMHAQRLAETYSLDAIEQLITEPPRCVMCGEAACKRCSRCQNEWYCRRECQVQHWPKHKQACNLLVESLEKIKLNEQQANTTS